MRRITPGTAWPLHGVAGTRQIEAAAARALPPHALMQRAGVAAARLACALAPHAGSVWVACGPGNNGGDGLEAAFHLHRRGTPVCVTLAADPARLPPDAAASWARAREAGVPIGAQPPRQWDLAIDAMLGIGASRAPEGALAQWAAALNAGGRVLALDVPSGLSADTGTGAVVRASHTLSLLTLKPGLFTASGRDSAGEVWLDTLGVDDRLLGDVAIAELSPAPGPQRRDHATHKGSFGDVAVIGGAAGMTGAAWLAGAAALHAGAGRVFVSLLTGETALAGAWPELMVRQAADLHLASMAVACGCGGGTAVATLLPRVLQESGSLVLDADALNAIAAEPALQVQLRERSRSRPTVLTPHPLEAARLLGTDTARVQSDRLAAAGELAARYGCTVVLKGSGTLIAQPGRHPGINPTGNARLATAGTGDVLAGLIGAGLAAGQAPFDAARAAVFRHGAAADAWPADRPLTAGALLQRL